MLSTYLECLVVRVCQLSNCRGCSFELLGILAVQHGDERKHALCLPDRITRLQIQKVAFNVSSQQSSHRGACGKIEESDMFFRQELRTCHAWCAGSQHKARELGISSCRNEANAVRYLEA